MHETSTFSQVQTGCVEFAALFLHPLMEEPPNSSFPADERRQYRRLARRAQGICQACPLMKQCLLSAVTLHDVAGYVAGTTARQRLAIRERLGVTVQPEDFDTLAGVTVPHRQVDHDEVVRLRNANPTESLETLAQRMGCSLSTVKRHLRKARAGRGVSAIRTELPSARRVLAAYAEVVTAKPAKTDQAA